MVNKKSTEYGVKKTASPCLSNGNRKQIDNDERTTDHSVRQQAPEPCVVLSDTGLLLRIHTSVLVHTSTSYNSPLFLSASYPVANVKIKVEVD